MNTTMTSAQSLKGIVFLPWSVEYVQMLWNQALKAQRSKVNIYDDIRQSLADAQAYERGARVDLRVTELPSPPKAKRITEKVK